MRGVTSGGPALDRPGAGSADRARPDLGVLRGRLPEAGRGRGGLRALQQGASRGTTLPRPPAAPRGGRVRRHVRRPAVRPPARDPVRPGRRGRPTDVRPGAGPHRQPTCPVCDRRPASGSPTARRAATRDLGWPLMVDLSGSGGPADGQPPRTWTIVPACGAWARRAWPTCWGRRQGRLLRGWYEPSGVRAPGGPEPPHAAATMSSNSRRTHSSSATSRSIQRFSAVVTSCVTASASSGAPECSGNDMAMHLRPSGADGSGFLGRRRHLDLARLGPLGDRDGQPEHAGVVAGLDPLEVEVVAEDQLAAEQPGGRSAASNSQSPSRRRALARTVSTLRSTSRSSVSGLHAGQVELDDERVALPPGVHRHDRRAALVPARGPAGPAGRGHGRDRCASTWFSHLHTDGFFLRCRSDRY